MKVTWREPLAIVAAFFVSRLAYWLADVRFESAHLDWYWQFADPALLRERLIETLWHMHMQPPLFNALIGIVAKAAPGSEGSVFAALYFLIGLAMTLALWCVMREIGVGAKVRLVLMAFWLLNPSIIIYERWLFYTYPVTVMLALATLCFAMALSRRSLRWAAAYLALLAAIALTRSVFHLIWVAASALMLVWAWSGGARQRRLLIALAALTIAPVLALYLKNAILFDRFAPSSWFGMSLMKITWAPLDLDERRALAAEGQFPESALYEPFWDLEYYAAWMPPAPETGIPILDQQRKASGWPNYNNSTYLLIEEANRRDALVFIRRWPGRYLANAARAALIYARPTHDVYHILPMRRPIAGWTRVWDAAFAGRFYYPPNVEDPNKLVFTSPWQRWLAIPWFHFIFLPALVGLGLWLAFREFGCDGKSPRGWLLLWCALQIIFVSGMAILFELGENNRFRFMTLPMSYILLAAVAAAVFTSDPSHSSTSTSRNKNPRP